MQHFPNPLTEKETVDFILRLRAHFDKYGFNYFATEILKTGELIGFIGLAYKDYESAFTPALDIVWRLKTSAWGNGYATEGAKRCLAYAFDELGLDQVISTCTLNNTKSEKVMKKIGMASLGTFKHPLLKEYPAYETCKCYIIDRVK